mmetsp:Transcript_18605/g.38591  ORF Transcript_18605/g.38591 Transcript_18605/m.38591 type:complete len:527 (-) Transcript_18605:1142-2722(-)
MAAGGGNHRGAHCRSVSRPLPPTDALPDGTPHPPRRSLHPPRLRLLRPQRQRPTGLQRGLGGLLPRRGVHSRPGRRDDRAGAVRPADEPGDRERGRRRDRGRGGGNGVCDGGDAGYGCHGASQVGAGRGEIRADQHQSEPLLLHHRHGPAGIPLHLRHLQRRRRRLGMRLPSAPFKPRRALRRQRRAPPASRDRRRRRRNGRGRRRTGAHAQRGGKLPGHFHGKVHQVHFGGQVGLRRRAARSRGHEAGRQQGGRDEGGAPVGFRRCRGQCQFQRKWVFRGTRSPSKPDRMANPRTAPPRSPTWKHHRASPSRRTRTHPLPSGRGRQGRHRERHGRGPRGNPGRTPGREWHRIGRRPAQGSTDQQQIRGRRRGRREIRQGRIGRGLGNSRALLPPSRNRLRLHSPRFHQSRHRNHSSRFEGLQSELSGANHHGPRGGIQRTGFCGNPLHFRCQAQSGQVVQFQVVDFFVVFCFVVVPALRFRIPHGLRPGKQPPQLLRNLPQTDPSASSFRTGFPRRLLRFHHLHE